MVGVFLLLAAAALITNSEERLSPLVPAGLAAGLAIGTKLTLLGPTLALTAGAIAIAPRGRRRAAGGAWLGPLVLAGGFWYLRNLIAVGNPLPWTSFGVLPTPAPPLQQHTGFAFVHYLLDSRAWSHFFSPALASGLGSWWYLIVAAVIIGPLLCLLPGAGRTVRMLGLVALASLVAYVVTPETAAGPRGDPVGFGLNLRYAAPALTLSLAVLPLAPVWASPRRQAALAVAGIALLVATLVQAPLWPGRHVPAAVAVAVVLLVGAVVFLRERGLPRPALMAVAGALLLVVAIGGYPWQRHYLRGRYQFKPGVSYLARVWTLFRTVHHARVGIVGTFGGFFSYPLYGIDDSNRVQYIARRGPHGSFRPIRTCSGWRAAVNGGHFRYLLTTPARDPWRPKRLGPSPESGWTTSDPAAHPILRQRATGQLIALYELSGDLDAGACG